MKKSIIVFVLCFLCMSPVAGQEWSFGVKGGANLPVGDLFVLRYLPKGSIAMVSEYFISKVEDNSQGFYAGGFVRHSLSSRFAVQAEALFSRQNSEGKIMWSCPSCITQFDDFATPITYKFTVDYLIVPMLARYTLFKNLNLELGPQIGFLLYAKNSTEFQDVLYDYKSVMRNVDFALAGGLTYTLFGHLDVTARYQQGLGNAYKSSFGADHTNRLFQLGAGYRF